MVKPTILVLGGCGFIGRNLVALLVEEDAAAAIRVVDKVPPQVAWLNRQCQAAFQNSLVEFKSANLINPESCKNAFTPPEKGCWDFVINCAGETKLAQTDPVYKEGILKLSLNCANEAANIGVRHYVELSSGNMFSSNKVPHKEDGPTDPWTFIAKWKQQVEEQLLNVGDLQYTILRLPVVYGLGDRSGLIPRIVLASIYKKLGETMKILWDANLRLSTIHVRDVCRAILFVCQRDDTVGQTYNVVDDADSTQGTVTDLLQELFGLTTSYYGNLVSAMVDLSAAADECNDKHLSPWAEACKLNNVQNTPLTPHMDTELLLHKHLWLDGSKLKNLGFNLSVPAPTIAEIQKIIDDYIDMKVFPSSLAP